MMLCHWIFKVTAGQSGETCWWRVVLCLGVMRLWRYIVLVWGNQRQQNDDHDDEARGHHQQKSFQTSSTAPKHLSIGAGGSLYITMPVDKLTALIHQRGTRRPEWVDLGGWLITCRHGLLVWRQLPISVLTGLDVKQLRWRRPMAYQLSLYQTVSHNDKLLPKKSVNIMNSLKIRKKRLYFLKIINPLKAGCINAIDTWVAFKRKLCNDVNLNAISSRDFNNIHEVKCSTIKKPM